MLAEDWRYERQHRSNMGVTKIESVKGCVKQNQKKTKHNDKNRVVKLKKKNKQKMTKKSVTNGKYNLTVKKL